MAAPPGGNEKKKQPWEYLRKYLLLLATLVATVAYSAGFSPPGGVWQKVEEDGPTPSPPDDHLPGDPILRDVNHPRYAVFFYLNAAAFASSLVVIVLILILSLRHELKSSLSRKWLSPLGVLRLFMVLDLLSLVGAYTAGIYRDRDVPVYTMILASVTVVYLVVFHMVLPRRPPSANAASQQDNRDHQKLSKVLMLLATFAVSVTYMAGLNAPGGFWNDAEDDHQPGEPILMGGSHETRLKVFVHSNSTAFFFSLLIAVQLLDKNLRAQEKLRFYLLCSSVFFALLGLVIAYVAGSCRETATTIYVITLLGAALAACIIVLILYRSRKKGDMNNSSSSGQQEHKSSNNKGDDNDKEKEARSLVLLLATLAATITYQAGLDPPGGLWENGGQDYKAGDPILRTMHHTRYNAFFYCNSIAFVASLVAILLVNKKQSRLLRETHALQAAMILDLFGLIGAYAAGSCRDVSTSIYAVALAGAVLVYVVIHVVFFTMDHDATTHGRNDDQVVEKRRKRLQLFAILAATITYQAGLTPPGGFHVEDGQAGDPVFLHNSPNRYKAFFYCNSVSFMLSIAMILLLVNKNIYKPAIQSNAISVCTAVGTFSLVGAFAAGSTQHMRTSIKIFGLVAAILMVLVLVILYYVNHSKGSGDAHGPEEEAQDRKEQDEEAQDRKEQEGKEMEEKEQHSQSKYLMLLGILAASVTYQAGLKPPGGVWQDEVGHVAGNPVMNDNGRSRYLAFFYINSASFVASIIVIILLLLKLLQKQWSKDTAWLSSRSLSAMNLTIVLDLLALLVAYAVGSARSLKATGYVFMLVFVVLAYIVIHAALTLFIRNSFGRENTPPTAPSPESNEEQVNGANGH